MYSSRRSLLRSLPSALAANAAPSFSWPTIPTLVIVERGSTKELKKTSNGALHGQQLFSPIHNIWRPGFSSARYETTSAKAEVASQTFNYQAEVSRLLDLIVHSLYSHKEVFLRELVSNASDALDKFRYLSVTEPSLLDGNLDLEVKVTPDPETGSLTITDTGIGMTKDELIQSLGTIAQSGTANFLKALKENKDKPPGDNSLIGQFGVGFYSAFLVAQRIVVSTKHPNSGKQYVWEGEADSSSFTIREEMDPEKLLARGTSITLFLKKDARHEYSDQNRILNLVKNYSQFVTFPIYVRLEKTREIAAADDSDKAKSKIGDTGEVKSKKRFVTEKYYTWELANEIKPIWMRSPKDVTKEEYEDFYKKTFKEFLEPLAYSHFSTEGEIEFKSILYIPGLPPFSSEEMINPKVKNIRMYVKRVFISDQFDNELFPRYLSFIKGVVDSNDLPLNVSREILQESRLMRVMKKRLVRKAFDMINDIAKRENKEDYKTFWTNFGKYIKLGCLEDTDNHKHLAPLLRFHSSKHAGKVISLKDYVQNMKKDQKSIYFLAADSLKSAQAAPFLEELASRDLEVLLLIETIDEVAVGNLKTFQGKPFVDITKEELDLGKDDDKKEMKKELRPLCDWMEKKLTGKIGNVQVSNRTMSSPCVIVAGKSGFSANMERILKAQALLTDMGDMMDTMRETRILEINPNHPVIKYLSLLYKDDPASSYATEMVELLYEATALSTGFAVEQPASFGRNISNLMATNLIKQKEHKVTV